MKKSKKNEPTSDVNTSYHIVGKYVLLISSFLPISCQKLVEVAAPSSSINAENVFVTDATASAVLTGIYTNMSLSNSFEFNNGGITSVSLFPALSADELTLYDLNNFTYLPYYSNSLTSSNIPPSADYWKIIYPIIFTLNSAIEGLKSSFSLSPHVKTQLLGEAKFTRAFLYFYLVNFYGDVPLILTSDWQVNASIIRNYKTKVYQQIIADLKDAQNMLSSDYLTSDLLTTTTERVRPTKWAATALLARTYLYTKDWANAENQATIVINQENQYKLDSLSSVFKRNSNESIWQLQTVNIDGNTGEGKLFILPSTGPSTGYNPVYLSNNITKSFEPGDQRKSTWTDSVIVGDRTFYYPFKYKIGLQNTTALVEYETVLRLAEQYLIRAESRAQQNNIHAAAADLNAIRLRAGLTNTTATTQSELLSAILSERKVELFTEWGHRWLDLKREKKLDDIMSAVTAQKGGVWKGTSQLYPVPLSELEKNPQLSQNLGY